MPFWSDTATTHPEEGETRARALKKMSKKGLYEIVGKDSEFLVKSIYVDSDNTMYATWMQHYIKAIDVNKKSVLGACPVCKHQDYQKPRDWCNKCQTKLCFFTNCVTICAGVFECMDEDMTYDTLRAGRFKLKGDVIKTVFDSEKYAVGYVKSQMKWLESEYPDGFWMSRKQMTPIFDSLKKNKIVVTMKIHSTEYVNIENEEKNLMNDLFEGHHAI